MSRHAREARPPALPLVNLLPESEFARLATRRLRRRFVAGGVALLVLVGGAWTAQHARVGDAEKMVAVEQAETGRLTTEVQRLAPVRAFVDGVALQERTVAGSMSGEIYVSEVLDGIRAATPSGAELTTLSVTLGATGADGAQAAQAGQTMESACPGPDPFNTRNVVGCVTLTGTAATRADVGQMVVALGESKLFVEPFISTTTTGEDASTGGVAFSGSVGLSEKVYSGRYGPPPTPAASPGTAPSGAAAEGSGS